MMIFEFVSISVMAHKTATKKPATGDHNVPGDGGSRFNSGPGAYDQPDKAHQIRANVKFTYQKSAATPLDVNRGGGLDRLKFYAGSHSDFFK